MLCLAACGGNASREEDGADTSATDMQIVVGRLDMVLAPTVTPSTVDSLLADTTTLRGIRAYSRILGDADTPPVLFARRIAHSTAVEAFYPMVSEVFPNLDNFTAIYSRACHNAAGQVAGEALFPDTVYTIISPYRQRVFAVGNYLFVATNHFLGSDNEAYEGFTEADRMMRTPAQMPYSALQGALRMRFPIADTDNINMLAALIYEGCVAFTLHEFLPDSPLHAILGIAESRWEEFRQNKSDIWKRMIENNVLFSTDPSLISRMTQMPVPTSVGQASFPAGTAACIGYALVAEISRRGSLPPIPERFKPTFYADGNVLRDAVGAF